MDYPKSTNIKKWEGYLKRSLTNKEKKLLINAGQEIQLNKYIYNLINNSTNKNLYIPDLTYSNGNCLFESICYHLNKLNINITPQDIRKIISTFLKIYKTYPEIFPNNTMTLYEMFNIQNEINYVYDKSSNELYVYNYDIMCSDLYCDNSWERLPTELILMCISFVFDIKIIISHDNGYTHDICTSHNIEHTIYIGLLGEFHYVPLDIKKNNDDKSDDITNYIILYNNFMDDFHQWIKLQLNKIIDKTDDSDESDNSDESDK
jgi:hypothetical protein